MGPKNPKQQAPPKGQKGTPQKGSVKQPAPKQVPKEKPPCPRCFVGMDPTGGDMHHKLSKCLKILPQRVADKFDKLWPGYLSNGDEDQDKIGSKKDADQLMQDIMDKPTGYKGKPITKRLLENAFQVAFNGLTVTSPPHPSTSNSVNTSSSTHTKIPGAVSSSSRNNTPSRNFTVDFPNLKDPRCTEPQYALAVHQQPNLDNSLASRSQQAPRPYPGKDVHVAANFVAVSKVQPKLHMYSISYGETERVRTKKEIDDEKKAAVATATVSSTAGLPEVMAAISIDDGAAQGQIVSNGNGDGDSTSASRPGKKVAQRAEKARIFEALADRPEFKDVKWATDYTLLCTLRPLTLTSVTDCIITAIEYHKLSGRTHRLDQITFTRLDPIDIGPTSSEATKRLLNVVRHPDQSANPRKGAGMRIAALNAFITKEVVSNADVISVGPNKFFVKDNWTPAGKTLKIRRGYFTSIRPGSDSVLLNVNVATSAFYNQMQVSRVYEAFSNPAEAQESLKGLTVRIGYLRDKHDEDYNPNLEKHRHRVIAGFGNFPEQQIFTLSTGELISVYEYFHRLGYEIQKKKLPCISVNIAPPKAQDGQSDSKQEEQKSQIKGKGESKPNQPPPNIHWIPPELLHIDSYQPYGKLLPPNLTEVMIGAAVRHPSKTQNMIMDEGFKLLGLKTTPSIFQQLQFDVGHQLIQVPGYLLDPPQITYKDQSRMKQDKIMRVQNASWNLKGVKFFSEPPTNGIIPYPLLAPICTIDFRPVIRHGGLANTGQKVSGHIMRNHGVRFAGGAENGDIYFNLEEALLNWEPQDQKEAAWNDDCITHRILTQFLEQHEDLRLAIVILPWKETEKYGIIKRVCDQWLGLHTVCIVEEKYISTDRQGREYHKEVDLATQSNLALKVNLKLRGQNHQVALPNSKTPFFEKLANDTIVFGADVSHAGSQMPFTPSVAAVVASDDEDFAHFPASMRLQASTREMIAELEDMVYYRLLRFRQVRNFMPTRVLFFRDGVSEDQFEICRKEEIPLIFNAYQKVLDQFGDAGGKGKSKWRSAREEMQLTFVVVGKRHHTCFFAIRNDQTWTDKNGQLAHPTDDPNDRNALKLNGNIKAGLLVDQVITRPTVDHTKDFFLQSHAALKGTSRSGHYSVLEMDGFNLDDIKTLTHAFCYNYQRATKGVSYVGPAYYADRLCERGTVYPKAYTAGRTQAPFPMSQQQKDMKKEGAEEYATDIAYHISGHKNWTAVRDDDEEPNPWHPDLDKCMFWL